MSSHTELDRTLTVNEIIQRVPTAVVTLAAHGIDTCCRGNESLDLAAAEAGIDPDVLLSQINSRSRASLGMTEIAPRGLPVVAKQCSCNCDDCGEKND
jgi:iron-sulfur cluster repair protein YtfE (RIC family)